MQDPYGICCRWFGLQGYTVSHAIRRTADTLRGSPCADSKLYSQLQHCSRLRPLHPRPTRRWSLASVFNPFAPTAITTMRHTVAHRSASMGRATSTTASSWAWAHGPAGAIATVGASIASSIAVEADTTVEAVRSE